ncbi:MipA/OmpV family protein [Entomohabitans teleogrylli]|uniref:MipA/OmpV family protein n=1 Tax=Entomohabitans teleogrylli TaxID=1384589 RepID=UPI00073D3FDD|nr:MipA/OmpV family protein [Entomohabitans teleogrylli]
MTRFKLLATGALFAVTFTAAHAQGPWTLGAGAAFVEHPYKEYKHDVYPVPVIGYEGESFWFRGLGAGYYLWNDTSDKLSITAFYSPTYFKPKDSDNRQLRQLDRRKSTMMAGLTYTHDTPYGYLRTTLVGDTLDNSNGIIWDIGWLYRYTNARWTVIPGIGVEWNSENQNEYYYGVSGNESRRSGLHSYDPDSGWNPWLALTVNFRLTDDWSVYGIGRYTRLSDEIKDSPMVNKSWSALFSTGITYSF